jgi:hypothetical protein
MDHITNDLLLYAKEFCLRSERDLLQQGNIGYMQAVMSMQDAVEFCQNAIMHEHGIAIEFQDNHKTRYKKINENLSPKKLPLESKMEALNTARGKVKHHASVPSSKDAENHVRFGREFLEQTFQEYFGVTFEMISRVLLITDENVRILFQRSEAMMAQCDYLESLIASKSAFLAAFPSIDLFIGASSIPLSRAAYMRTDPLLRPVIETVTDAVKVITSRIARVEEAIMLSISGINYGRYKNFLAITPVISTYSHYKLRRSIYIREDAVLSKEVAQEAYEFALEAALSWQRLRVLGRQSDELGDMTVKMTMVREEDIEARRPEQEIVPYDDTDL